MNLELEGKVALVTAASRGIGAATAQRLAREGAKVAIAARSVSPTGKQVEQGIYPYTADLGNAEATAALIPKVLKDFGRLDILVLNTPGPKIAPVLELDVEDWAAAYDMLVRPVVQLALAGAKQMVKQGSGSIVFLTSTWVKQPATGGVLSASMRSALSAFCKQMALELGPLGVRVNQVQPGATGTDRMTNIVKMKAAKLGTTVEAEIGKIVADIPMKRWGQADEIADAIAFIVSQRASFITGSTLQVDGGAIRSTQ
ncbi:MAG: SDR family oxidoreductase [Burkholderiaceae bacterium]|nr:SDR family oxidoreductase [Burkholderiaceae bacterium]